MDRLTKKEIEIMRSYDPNVEGPLTRKGMRKFQSICDMALQSLSQESVRSEALEDIIRRAIPFVAGYPAESKRAGELCAEMLNDMNRALQSTARVAEGESDDAVKFAAHLIATAPESPAKEQPGEQFAAPQASAKPTEPLDIPCEVGPAVAAPDVAMSVRDRLVADLIATKSPKRSVPDVAKALQAIALAEEVVFNAAIVADDRMRYEEAKNHRKLSDALKKAAALIEKLGQRWIPVAWAVTWNGDIVDNIFSTERAAKECMERLNRNHPSITCAIVPLAALPPPPERP